MSQHLPNLVGYFQCMWLHARLGVESSLWLVPKSSLLKQPDTIRGREALRFQSGMGGSSDPQRPSVNLKLDDFPLLRGLSLQLSGVMEKIAVHC